MPLDGSWPPGPQGLLGFLQEQDCYLRAKFLTWVQQRRSQRDVPWLGSTAPRLNHRIMESLRLEKTSKIIKSNLQANTTKPGFVEMLRHCRASNAREKLCNF